MNERVQADRFIDVNEVMAMTSLSRTTIWRGVRAGWFPQAAKLTQRRIAWPAQAVRDWLAERASQKEAA